MKQNVIIGLFGPSLDGGVGKDRWNKWRPSLSLCQHEDLLIHRFEILIQNQYEKVVVPLLQDIQSISPETEVRSHLIEMNDPWDFEQVYSTLYDFSRRYPFNPEEEEYWIHITTGTHVAQICLFLLTEANYFPGKLIQTSPPMKREGKDSPGGYTIIDLDLSKYDQLFSRFKKEREEGLSFLKSGIQTRNPTFNLLMEKIEKVAIASKAPLLLMGPTGAGKSKIAQRIFELKKMKRQIQGPFVEVNCATLRGDGAMSALFGHVKGAFTGALQARPGFLKKAHEGILFLDEIGELGLDEQAMLLKALEEKKFIPFGSDTEVQSNFQLIAGTNRDLRSQVGQGKFREDLLTRIHLWTFELPALKDRLEDIEPNLQYELDGYSELHHVRVTFNKEAKEKFLKFAASPEAKWSGNFRDLNASVTRMATLAMGGRIQSEMVEEEILRLKQDWGLLQEESSEEAWISSWISQKERSKWDLFDWVQLKEVLKICRTCKNLSEAGRKIFSASRKAKKSVNDADRLSKYLARFGLSWEQVQS